MNEATLRRLHLMKPFLWTVYALVLFWATHFRIPNVAKTFVSENDKIIHAAAFFVLAVLSCATFLRANSPRSHWWLLTVGLMIYAAIDEYTQQFFQRTPDILDWFMDCAGIACGVFFTRWKRALLCRSEKVNKASVGHSVGHGEEETLAESSNDHHLKTVNS